MSPEAGAHKGRPYNKWSGQICHRMLQYRRDCCTGALNQPCFPEPCDLYDPCSSSNPSYAPFLSRKPQVSYATLLLWNVLVGIPVLSRRAWN